MKVEIWAIGKLKQRELSSSIDQYLKRMRKYQPVILDEILVKTRSTNPDILRKAEAEKILSKLSDGAFLLLMDETGKRFNSVEFADFIQKFLMQPTSRLVFLIGGAYGFDQSIYHRAQEKISLSPMTFPHDLARLVTVEQLYRAFSILNNSPYHH